MDLIRRSELLSVFKRWERVPDYNEAERHIIKAAIYEAENIPAVDAVEIPETGIGDLSDGYHTFNGLYRQRLILFAALVKAYKDRSWKSYRHEDGELCFGGGWFIVGIDTPEGSYTYHYENKDFDLFDCEEIPEGKHWDGHTEDDVTRLLSLAVDTVEVVRCRECLRAEPHYSGSEFYACELLGTVRANDYCSWGQRREEDDA